MPMVMKSFVRFNEVHPRFIRVLCIEVVLFVRASAKRRNVKVWWQIGYSKELPCVSWWTVSSVLMRRTRFSIEVVVSLREIPAHLLAAAVDKSANEAADRLKYRNMTMSVTFI